MHLPRRPDSSDLVDRIRRTRLPVRRLLTLLVIAAGCSNAAVKPAAPGSGTQPPSGNQPDPARAPGFDAGSGLSLPDGGAPATTPAGCMICDDFPAAPVIATPASAPPGDAGAPTTPPTGAPVLPVPANVAELFGPADRGTTGGPCLLEPESGTLVPRNWLRPRFRIKPAAGQTLFELRLSTPRQKNPLIVYTTGTTWTMPKPMWTALAAHAGDAPINVQVRGLDASKPGLPAKSQPSSWAVAPVDAGGSIVYWTTSGGSAFKGFAIGDESVVPVLRPNQTEGRCVGCHSSTPDGLYVAFASSSASDNGNPAHPELRSGKNPTATPDFITPIAQTLLNRPEQQLPTFSKAHWSPGDRIMLTMWKTQIMWTDLEATSDAQDTGWGFLGRGGDTHPGAGFPSFSHDGSFIAYVASSSLLSAGATKDGDIYRVPFGQRKGGDAKPVDGAATPDWNEYYPSPSPDDKFLAFTRAPNGLESYHNPKAEIFVVPSAGGSAVRFAANDPALCSGTISPGITNSWPKWAPVVNHADGKSYYWLTFSSTRSDGGKPQLYVTPLVLDDASGKLATYPAIYLWNQPLNESNHTPAWDIFDIPIDL
jgi:hypothetical protein